MAPPKSPSDVTIRTNGAYIGLSHAGSGITADVWYALPRKTLKHLIRPADIVALRSQVCAVKLYHPFSSYYVRSELAAMKHLQNVPEDLRARFTEPLDLSLAEQHVDGPRWYAMKAVNGFTLAQLRNTAQASNAIIPPEFVFHAYLQLTEALQFLHRSDPPMLKGDMIAVNVMVDPSVQDTPGFPNVKVIDFGGAEIGASRFPRAVENERCWLNTMIYDLAVLNHACRYIGTPTLAGATEDKGTCVHGIEFTDFVDTLRRALTADRYLDGSNAHLEIDLQERIPKILRIRRDFASEEALRAIERMVEETREMAGVKFPTDQQILDALEMDT